MLYLSFAMWILHLNVLLFGFYNIFSANASPTDYFITPLNGPVGGPDGFGPDSVLELGTIYNISWVTEYTNYTIQLWQAQIGQFEGVSPPAAWLVNTIFSESPAFFSWSITRVLTCNQPPGRAMLPPYQALSLSNG